MDDGSVIDEEEEEEEEEEVELFDDSYLRLSTDRANEDMLLLPSYQHYVDTIETIDTMIFGNRLSNSQSNFADDQTLIGFTAPATGQSFSKWLFVICFARMKQWGSL